MGDINKYKMKLDNTAIIHMASKNKDWLNMFRISVHFKEEIDSVILQKALNKIYKRFPTIAARITNDLFWYYQQPIKKAPKIKKDTALLKPMSNQALYNCAFRILYSEKSIHVELFHSLTDGRGGMIFVKSLTYEYLKLKHHISISSTTDILLAEDDISDGEVVDSYRKDKVIQNKKINKAYNKVYQLQGKKMDQLIIEKFILDIKDIKSLAKKMEVSLTVLICSIIMKALLDLQEQEISKRHQRPISIFLPIDLRNMFNSHTLRNFVLYIKPQIHPTLQGETLTDIIDSVKKQFEEGLSKERMQDTMNKNVSLQNNVLVKYMPLFLKKLFMKKAFKFSEKSTCLTVSNIGLIQLDQKMDKYIESFDCILNTRSDSPYNCGIISYHDKIHINFIRNIDSSKLESNIGKIFNALNISWDVQKQVYKTT
ncbi:hypothetical protein [Mammaliicoccus vitulinus]|uniref:hypothetical protein n=1 Tax=Mammaliicoccus vitulinus TaxID=71237 RepID=UPI00145C0E2E|nr:hypothetical protein [Mammaliicoccus vitulinus]QJF25051.1 hypothetical protein HF021_06015 [Mammaliicoccus vitulinus]